MTLEDFATNADMVSGLREPFPAHLVSTIQKHGHSESYVNHAAVTDRLNRECPGWTNSEPQFLWSDDGHIVGVVCSLTIGSVTRWEVGDAEGKSNPGDEAKKAMSDWIKRAAMRFGVALDLWSKVELQDARGSTAEANTVPSHDAEGTAPGSIPGPLTDGPEAVAGAAKGPGELAKTQGEGVEASSPTYLTEDEVKALADRMAMGRNDLVKLAHSRWENVRRWQDLTTTMAKELSP